MASVGVELAARVAGDGRQGAAGAAIDAQSWSWGLRRTAGTVSAQARAMDTPSSLSPDVAAEPSEQPCGFTTFVARRRGIGLRDAEQLIEHWLETYEPTTPHPLFLSTETNDDRDTGRLRNCA